MHYSPSRRNDASVEVEEADLSSDDQRHSSNPRDTKQILENDSVLSKHDEHPEYEPDTNSLSPSPSPKSNDALSPSNHHTQSKPSSTSSSIPKSPPPQNSSHHSSDNQNPTSRDHSPFSPRHNDSTSPYPQHQHQHEANGHVDSDVQMDAEDNDIDLEDDDLLSTSQSKQKSGHELTNGNIVVESDSDSEDPSTGIKRTRRSQKKLVIPDDMRNDTRYFRRSSRSRHAPERLSISPRESPAASSVGSDSDYQADDGKLRNLLCPSYSIVLSALSEH